MLDTDLAAKPTGTAIATGLIVAALIDELIEKGILTRDDVSGALQRAMDGLGTSVMTADSSHASQVIASVMRHVAYSR